MIEKAKHTVNNAKVIVGSEKFLVDYAEKLVKYIKQIADRANKKVQNTKIKNTPISTEGRQSGKPKNNSTSNQ